MNLGPNDIGVCANRPDNSGAPNLGGEIGNFYTNGGSAPPSLLAMIPQYPDFFPTAMPQSDRPLIRDLLGSVGKRTFCSIGNIDIGLGADGYAGFGGSVGGSFKLDLTTGQTGVDGYSAVGVGLGIEAGPTVTFSSSGNSIVSANLITQVGGGFGVGVAGTRTLIGTNPNQNSLTIGKIGSPIGFVNGGAAIGFHTPPIWDLGC